MIYAKKNVKLLKGIVAYMDDALNMMVIDDDLYVPVSEMDAEQLQAIFRQRREDIAEWKAEMHEKGLVEADWKFGRL